MSILMRTMVSTKAAFGIILFKLIVNLYIIEGLIIILLETF